jgi:hypothetical protein
MTSNKKSWFAKGSIVAVLALAASIAGATSAQASPAPAGGDDALQASEAPTYACQPPTQNCYCRGQNLGCMTFQTCWHVCGR